MIGINALSIMKNVGKPLGGFNPLSIAGLALWVDSHDTNTILNASDLPASDGENIKTWQDKSGNNAHLIQATAINQPVFRAAGSSTDFPSSCPTVDLDDVVNGTYLQDLTATNLMSDTTTEFFVFSNTGGGGSNNAMLAGGSALGHGFLGNGTNTTNAMGAGQHAGGFGNAANFLNDTPIVATFQYTGDANSKMWKNYDLLGTTSCGTNNADGLTIGAYQTGGNPMQGEVVAYLNYDSILTADQVLQVQAYLVDRYGVDAVFRLSNFEDLLSEFDASIANSMIADDDEIAADGIAVKQWIDQKLNTYDFFQTTVAKQPLLDIAGSPFSTPCLSLDGTDDYMITASAFPVNGWPLTTFIVWTPNDPFTSNRQIWTSQSVGNGSAFNESTGTDTFYQVSTGNFNGHVYVPGTAILTTLVWDQTVGKHYTNTTLQGTVAIPTARTLAGQVLGALKAGNNNGHFKIACLAQFDGDMSLTGDLADIQAGIMAKYGIV